MTTTGLTVLTPGPWNPIVIEENNRVYLVIYGWNAASELELFTGLQELPLRNPRRKLCEDATIHTDPEHHLLFKKHDQHSVEIPPPPLLQTEQRYHCCHESHSATGRTCP